ncbi:MAG: hypothetical protein KAS17_08430 [Victivallaceae bacterium]|nr:hypothetical protein [Victivallaceae bacterium]
MEKKINNQVLHESLTMLNELLERHDEHPCSLVVCGGSALIAAGLVTRTTKDIDILGQVVSGRVVPLNELPEIIKELSEAVAEELNFPKNWFNTGPSSIINVNLSNNGLPNGFEHRLIKRQYGSKLTIFFIGRIDQIFFKTYAAVDKGGPTYHSEDLLKLKPTPEEMLQAAQWSMSQDPSYHFKISLVQMLESLGFKDVAEQL